MTPQEQAAQKIDEAIAILEGAENYKYIIKYLKSVSFYLKSEAENER